MGSVFIELTGSADERVIVNASSIDAMIEVPGVGTRILVHLNWLVVKETPEEIIDCWLEAVNR